MWHWEVQASWNMMAHAQKPDFVFRRYGRVHLNRRGRQFSRLLAAEVCASAVVMLDTPCSEVVWRVLAIHSVRQFPLHFPARASPCAITFQTGLYSCVMFVLGQRRTQYSMSQNSRAYTQHNKQFGLRLYWAPPRASTLWFNDAGNWYCTG